MLKTSNKKKKKKLKKREDKRRKLKQLQKHQKSCKFQRKKRRRLQPKQSKNKSLSRVEICLLALLVLADGLNYERKESYQIKEVITRLLSMMVNCLSMEAKT